MHKRSKTIFSRSNFARLLFPTYTGPEIRRYFGGAWSMHLPFAWDLIRELQPRSFVELGVYNGESYFTFCQSVEENGLSTLCYGIDTWRGDIHMGSYGPELGREVETYNVRYSGFSKLLKMTFNEALAQFPDASIDLLHIDGSHRYEDVKEDFEKWLPKLSDRGVVLLHDVMVRDGDFGVWRLWQEIARRKASFVFDFGHGLGIWKKEAVSKNDSPFIRKLFLASEKERREIMNHYALAAAAIDLSDKAQKRVAVNGSSILQLFAPRCRTYGENHSNACEFPTGRWCCVRVDLPWQLGDGSGGLRFDPGNQAGIIDIAGILIRSKLTGRVLWRAKTPIELSGVTVGGTAIRIPHERVLRILSFGIDPQLILPVLAGSPFDSPLTFQVWMRLDSSVQVLGKGIADLQSHYQSREQELRKDLESKVAALLQSAKERALLEIELREARDRAESSRAELAVLRSELEREEREVWDSKVRRADLTARLKDRDQRIQEIQASVAWKIAKPFWKLQRHFSRRPTDTSKSGELVFALDGPGTWTASHDALAMKGWCFARGGPQIIGVRAKIGRKSYFARYGLKREDVAQTNIDYPAAFYSGFSIIVPIPKGTSSVRLEAIAQGRSWECFHEESLISAKEDGRDVSAHKHESEDVLSKRITFPYGTCEQQPLVLYPRIRANDVLPILAPLIEQHTKRVRSETPFFSVITPTFNTLPRWLAEASASLLNQTFADWEWCLIDDGSQGPKVREMLEALASAHSRFRPKFVKAAGISSATNEALDLATGEFVCFLDHDDLLHPEALAQMAEKLEEGFDIVYSDEDKLDDKKGKLIEPFFKPEWSPEYFRGAMYVGHLLCVRRELACRVRLDSAFDGIQDFDFMLRVSETGARIGHIARVLYHWRKTPGSIADTCDAKPHAAALQEKAVNAHLERLGLPARAEQCAIPHRLKIVPAPRKSFPKISIIIPTKDSPELLSRCLNSLYENTSYPKFEVILIDNDTTSTEALATMRAHPVIRIYLSNPFNFSRANNLGAQHATGEYLVFLNNDTEIIAARWLDHLLYYAEQPDIGAVGALLLHDDGAVQHGGVVLGMRGTADHAMRGFTAKSDGYAGSLSCAREVSAVTAACMMMRKSTFHELKGFNEHFFTIYQDLDLCLRLRESGLRIIWTPRAVLLHHESLSRQKYYDVVDRYLLLDQWQDTIEGGDPYYNPNLNLDGGDYSLRSNVC